MSYCGNCGTELPQGARFCSACGTPVQAAYGGGMNAMPYPSGNQSGGVPYQNIGMNQNIYSDSSVYGQEPQIYACGQVYGSSLPPYADGQRYGNNLPPYADGQRYGNDLPLYAGGQINGYHDAAPVAGGMYAGNPYDPYGRAVQPKSTRKTLMIVGMVVGLIAAVTVILLIVLLTRDHGNRSYEQAVGVFMNGFERQELDRLKEAFPERVREDLWREMSGASQYAQTGASSGLDLEESFWRGLNEELEWYCGKQITMTYEITSAEPIDDYRLREYERRFLEDFQYEVSFGAGYSVDVEIVFQGSEDGRRSRLRLKTVMIGKNWYVIDPVLGQMSGIGA